MLLQHTADCLSEKVLFIIIGYDNYYNSGERMKNCCYEIYNSEYDSEIIRFLTNEAKQN